MKRKRKALGQHFLKSPAVLEKILQVISPDENDLVIEIGAGKGALTFPLAERAGKVIAVEKDPYLIPFLLKRSFSNLIIMEKDILRVDFREIMSKEKKIRRNVKLVGNLPYSLSSPLLFKILKNKELFTECIFLLQKEFAERICGEAGSKIYAPLSILFQIYFLAKIHFLVSPDSFSPPPKVKSALISLKRREQPLFLLNNEELFHRFLKAAFQHRRKILINNLKMINLPLSLINDAYKKLGLEKNIRPEQLTISKFVALFNFFLEKGTVPFF